MKFQVNTIFNSVYLGKPSYYSEKASSYNREKLAQIFQNYCYSWLPTHRDFELSHIMKTLFKKLAEQMLRCFDSPGKVGSSDTQMLGNTAIYYLSCKMCVTQDESWIWDPRCVKSGLHGISKQLYPRSQRNELKISNFKQILFSFLVSLLVNLWNFAFSKRLVSICCINLLRR